MSRKMVLNKNRELFVYAGDSTRGARAPLCVVAGEGYIGEGPRRKGPFPMRAFAYFSHEGKVGRGPGATPPRNYFLFPRLLLL